MYIYICIYIHIYIYIYNQSWSEQTKGPITPRHNNTHMVGENPSWAWFDVSLFSGAGAVVRFPPSPSIFVPLSFFFSEKKDTST